MNSTTPELKNKIVKTFIVTIFGLFALFGIVYLMLWKSHCGQDGVCDVAFPFIQKTFRQMWMTGAVIAGLCGWVIHKAFNRVN